MLISMSRFTFKFIQVILHSYSNTSLVQPSNMKGLKVLLRSPTADIMILSILDNDSRRRLFYYYYKTGFKRNTVA